MIKTLKEFVDLRAEKWAKESEEKSKCCNAPVELFPSIEDKPGICTRRNVCTKCGKHCGVK